MSIAPFKSSGELIDYARLFLRHRVKAFRKDIRVCLTADKTGRHAYFPGLIACITFLDQLSGLYSGKLEGHNDAELTNYATKFLGTKYPPDLIALLYHMFRHELAHLGHPYAVFDTATRPGKFPGPRRRITWTVYASRRHQPIELKHEGPLVKMTRFPTPWPVYYDHRVHISVRRIATDAVNSVYGPTGYLAHLASDGDAQQKFAACMKQFFPA